MTNWNALYREFNRSVRPLLRNGERQMRYSDMKLWESWGLVYALDGDQTRMNIYGLTEVGETVRGARQMQAAVEAHRAEMERRRVLLMQAEHGAVAQGNSIE